MGRDRGEVTTDGVVETATWSVGIAGLILFIIPGIYIRVRPAVSIEALVVEGRRGTQAMGRSWELVDGHWWHAFGTLVVAGLLTGVVNALITAPFGDTSWFVQAVAASVATVATLPYGVLVGVLLYLDLPVPWSSPPPRKAHIPWGQAADSCRSARSRSRVRRSLRARRTRRHPCRYAGTGHP